MDQDEGGEVHREHVAPLGQPSQGQRRLRVGEAPFPIVDGLPDPGAMEVRLSQDLTALGQFPLPVGERRSRHLEGFDDRCPIDLLLRIDTRQLRTAQDCGDPDRFGVVLVRRCHCLLALSWGEPRR